MAGAAGGTSAACEKLNRLKIEESGALSSEGRQLAALKSASIAIEKVRINYSESAREAGIVL